MSELIRILFTGLSISLLGSLPLGVLNITAMQVAIEENSINALKFALGVALVEIIYVRISLTGINWVMEHQQLFHVLEWFTVFLFLGLAVSSFITAGKSRNQKNILLDNKMNRFLLGFSMSAVNPVQIPFWFIWSTYLLSNEVLQPTQRDYNAYTVGIGIGTMAALAIFIFAGKWLVRKLNASHRIINIAVGVIFVLSAAFQLYRVLTRPFKEQLKGKSTIEKKK